MGVGGAELCLANGARRQPYENAYPCGEKSLRGAVRDVDAGARWNPRRTDRVGSGADGKKVN